jgi:transcriptional regulator with XRE-family HTH domain
MKLQKMIGATMQNHDEFSVKFKRWVADWERENNLYRVPLKEISERIGVAFPTFSRWWNGIHTPDEESCFRIAKFLGISAEDVLIAAGHKVTSPLTLPSLIESIKQYEHEWDEISFVNFYLNLTQTSEWQSSNSYWKHDAENTLLTTTDTRAKAGKIAQIVYAWRQDPDREKPIQDKPLNPLP